MGRPFPRLLLRTPPMPGTLIGRLLIGLCIGPRRLQLHFAEFLTVNAGTRYHNHDRVCKMSATFSPQTRMKEASCKDRCLFTVQHGTAPLATSYAKASYGCGACGNLRPPVVGLQLRQVCCRKQEWSSTLSPHIRVTT